MFFLTSHDKSLHWSFETTCVSASSTLKWDVYICDSQRSDAEALAILSLALSLESLAMDSEDIGRDDAGPSGKLGFLYSDALQTSKATMEEEALQALDTSNVDTEDSSEESLQELPLEEIPPQIPARRSLYEKHRLTRLNTAKDSYKEMLDSGSLFPADPIDFFSKTNPDSFNMDGKPVRQPRWRPPRAGDARRRPHVPLDQDFDSPSEEESSEEEAQAKQRGKVPKAARSKAKAAKARAPHRESSQRGAPATEMKMGQADMQERPRQAKDLLALSDISRWPCGPYCCIEHCRNIAKGCSTLLEGLSWTTLTPPKKSEPRGVFKLEEENISVMELREIRQRQLALKTCMPSTRTQQRASWDANREDCEVSRSLKRARSLHLL